MNSLIARRGFFHACRCLLATTMPTVAIAREATNKGATKDEQERWWQSEARYTKENDAIIQTGRKIDCVFLGDSITERWPTTRPAFFSPSRISRGITGQTTPQMILRFRADVVALKPDIVHIMAGTNDIAGNTGPETPDMIVDNIATMTEIAHANAIKVILASVLPAARYPWAPRVNPVEPTREVNAKLRDYASRVGAVYADYYLQLDNGHGALPPGYGIGDVHPTSACYDVMERITVAKIKEAMAGKTEKLCKK